MRSVLYAFVLAVLLMTAAPVAAQFYPPSPPAGDEDIDVGGIGGTRGNDVRVGDDAGGVSGGDVEQRTREAPVEASRSAQRPGAGPGAGLAFTGANVLATLGAAVAFVLLGGLLLRVSRLRNRST